MTTTHWTDRLRALGACEAALRFSGQFDTYSAALAACDNPAWKYWLARGIPNTGPARAEYDRVVAPAQAEYGRVCDGARAEYGRVVAPARAEYGRVWDGAQAEYLSSPEVVAYFDAEVQS